MPKNRNKNKPKKAKKGSKKQTQTQTLASQNVYFPSGAQNRTIRVGDSNWEEKWSRFSDKPYKSTISAPGERPEQLFDLASFQGPDLEIILNERIGGGHGGVKSRALIPAGTILAIYGGDLCKDTIESYENSIYKMSLSKPIREYSCQNMRDSTYVSAYVNDGPPNVTWLALSVKELRACGIVVNPSLDETDKLICFVALTNIEAGEELFCHYGDGQLLKNSGRYFLFNVEAFESYVRHHIKREHGDLDVGENEEESDALSVGFNVNDVLEKYGRAYTDLYNRLSASDSDGERKQDEEEVAPNVINIFAYEASRSDQEFLNYVDYLVNTPMAVVDILVKGILTYNELKSLWMIFLYDKTFSSGVNESSSSASQTPSFEAYSQQRDNLPGVCMIPDAAWCRLENGINEETQGTFSQWIDSGAFYRFQSEFGLYTSYLERFVSENSASQSFDDESILLRDKAMHYVAEFTKLQRIQERDMDYLSQVRNYLTYLTPDLLNAYPSLRIYAKCLISVVFETAEDLFNQIEGVSNLDVKKRHAPLLIELYSEMVDFFEASGMIEEVDGGIYALASYDRNLLDFFMGFLRRHVDALSAGRSSFFSGRTGPINELYQKINNVSEGERFLICFSEEEVELMRGFLESMHINAATKDQRNSVAKLYNLIITDTSIPVEVCHTSSSRLVALYKIKESEGKPIWKDWEKKVGEYRLLRRDILWSDHQEEKVPSPK